MATYISQFIRWDSSKTPSGKVQQTCQLGTLVVFLLVRGQMFFLQGIIEIFRARTMHKSV